MAKRTKRRAKNKRGTTWQKTLKPSILKQLVTIPLFLIVGGLMIMLTIAWLGRKTVHISFANGFPPVIDFGVDVPKASPLSTTPQLEDLNSIRIAIKLLPPRLQENTGDISRRVIEELQQSELRRDSVWCCANIIAEELAAHVSIDTRIRGGDDHCKEVYRAVQAFLCAIDCYSGDLDGDQARTKEALDRFQKAENLQVDSKLGRRTFSAMLNRLRRKVLH